MKERPILRASLFIMMGIFPLVARNPGWFVQCAGAILLIGGIGQLYVALWRSSGKHKAVEKSE